jgi:cytochrome P450
MYTYDLLRSRETFGDDAEEFKPFRFVNTNSSATKIDNTFIVFGGGKHACPGYLPFINYI